MTRHTLRFLPPAEVIRPQPLNQILGTNMTTLKRLGTIVLIALLATSLRAADTVSDFETLKKEIEELKKDNADIKKTNAELASKLKPAGASSADKALDAKYGPNASVVTKTGKLRISGLLQVWFYKPSSLG